MTARFEHHGGRRAYLRYLYWRAAGWFGQLDLWRETDLRVTERLVFVCKGNICRSPYAEARAREFGLPAESAGLLADSGQSADKEFALVAHAMGLNLTSHRARNIGELTISSRDTLLVFEPGQARALSERSWQGGRPTVILLGLLCSPPVPYIHDPYGARKSYAKVCAVRIDQAVKELKRRFVSCRERVG